jgi:hypothetical protein
MNVAVSAESLDLSIRFPEVDARLSWQRKAVVSPRLILLDVAEPDISRAVPPTVDKLNFLTCRVDLQCFPQYSDLGPSS